MNRASLALLVLLMPATAGADAAKDRLQRAVGIVLREAPRLAERRAELAARRLAGIEQSAASDPYMEIQSEGLDRLSGRADNATDYLRIGTPFWAPFQVRTARVLRETAGAFGPPARAAAEREAVRRVVRAFFGLALARERRLVLEERSARLRRVLAIARARLAVGEIAGVEVVQLELDAARSAAGLSSSLAEIAAFEQELVRLGVPEDLWPAPGDLARFAARVRALGLPSREALEQRIGHAPDIVAADAAARLERALADHAAASVRGPWEFDLEWERIPDLGGAPARDAWGFRLRVPLGLGPRRRAARARAVAEAAAADARREARERAVRAGIVAAHRRAGTALQRLEGLEAGRVSDASLGATLEEQFRLGAVDYLALISGFTVLEDVQLERLAARHDLAVARCELALLAGAPEERRALGIATEDTR